MFSRLKNKISSSIGRRRNGNNQNPSKGALIPVSTSLDDFQKYSSDHLVPLGGGSSKKTDRLEPPSCMEEEIENYRKIGRHHGLEDDYNDDDSFVSITQDDILRAEDVNNNNKNNNKNDDKYAEDAASCEIDLGGEARRETEHCVEKTNSSEIHIETNINSKPKKKSVKTKTNAVSGGEKQLSSTQKTDMMRGDESETRRLKPYVFVYNECANRHWNWNKLSENERKKRREPEWDESWQPHQPNIVKLLKNLIDHEMCFDTKRLHSISRLFNFLENTLDDVDENNTISDCGDMKETCTTKAMESSGSFQSAMSRMEGVPWEKDVFSTTSENRRNLCMLQVELLITKTNSYPNSDQHYKDKLNRGSHSRVTKRQSTIVVTAQDITTSDPAMDNVNPISDPEKLQKGYVARMREEFKKSSKQIENSMMVKNGQVKRAEKKVAIFGKMNLVFKGNGKFGTILKAGQTGAANEDMLGLQGGPVEIIAMRDYFVDISLLYIFSMETLQENDVQVKSQGLKEMEKLIDPLSNKKVGELAKLYAEMDEDCFRQTKRNATQTDENENVEKQLKRQEMQRRRQEEESQKWLWTSKMRYLRESILELLSAKFLPQVMLIVVPRDVDKVVIEKYVKIELTSCANKTFGLPKGWPNMDNILVVHSLSTQKNKGALDKLIFT